MKRHLFLLIILSLCSCKSLPVIQPFDTSSNQFNRQLCSDLFPKGKWQFIHSIEATMPNNKKAFVLGVTRIDSRENKVSVIMMTIEGLVLLDAQYNQELRINKAIPPFDSNEFASGLIEDVRLIFFKPDGRMIQSGYLKGASCVCRYIDNEEYIVDLYLNQNKTWEIKKYNTYNKLIRRVKAFSILEKQGKLDTRIPQRIELFAEGDHAYSLQMDLIEAKQI
jgi:hypothetical protein